MIATLIGKIINSFFIVINHPSYNLSLAEDLSSWNEIKTKLTTGSITKAEYDEWRYHYPEGKVAAIKAARDAKRAKR